MALLDREERKTLRGIQHHLNETLRESQTVVEQIGTVDVYFHPSNPDPYLNCATPHKGVAWVRRDDLETAFAGLTRLGRVPRLVFQDALFPEAFQKQLQMMGLSREDERVILVYQPLFGPIMEDETPLGCLPPEPPPSITYNEVSDRADLAIWLRTFRAGYFNTEILTVSQEAVDPLWEDLEAQKRLFTLAYFDRTPLGAARVVLRPPLAEIESVVTAPHWHGMGLEIALTMAAVRAAEERECETIFTIAAQNDFRSFYHRLGFVELTRVLTFWEAEVYAKPTPGGTSILVSPDTDPDIPTVTTEDAAS